MTFHQKNTAVTLASFSLLLIFFLLRISQLVRNQNFNDTTVVRLWLIVVVLSIVVSVVGIMLTHGIPAVLNARAGDGDPEIDDLIDERDERIDLEGTHLTYRITSIGTFVASLTFALNQPPLVMFSLLLFFGLVGQIAGDGLRLRRYQQE
jgi:hypothetical protein